MMFCSNIFTCCCQVLIFDIDLLCIICFGQAAPVARYMFKMCIILICAFWAVIVHVVITMLRYGGKLSVRQYVFGGRLGTIIQVLYISVVTCVLLPLLACSTHTAYRQW